MSKLTSLSLSNFGDHIYNNTYNDLYLLQDPDQLHYEKCINNRAKCCSRYVYKTIENYDMYGPEIELYKYLCAYDLDGKNKLVNSILDLIDNDGDEDEIERQISKYIGMSNEFYCVINKYDINHISRVSFRKENRDRDLLLRIKKKFETKIKELKQRESN